MLITELILIVSLLCFTLGIYTWLYDRKSRVHTLFGLSTCLVGVWIFLNYIFQKTNSLVILRTIYAIAPFILSSVVLWVTSLKYRTFKKGFIGFNLVVLFINSFLAYLSLSTTKIVESVTNFYEYNTGAYFDYYTFYSLLLFACYVYYFILEYRHAEKIFKDQVKLILTGVIFTVVLAAVVGFVLPAFGITQYNIFDSPSSIFFVIFSVYSIMKYKFLNIKVIATEVFATLLIVLSFKEVLEVLSLTEFLTKSFIFIITFIFGILLIRSVIAEVRRREEMEMLSRELAVANEKLRELDKAKTDFLSIASHQLRSPLTVTKLGIGALLDGTFGPVKEEKQRYAMNRIFESNERLIGLVNDFLNISRIEMGKIQYDLKPGDLKKTIDSVCEELKPKAEVKKLKLVCEKSKESLPMVNFDEEKVRQVVVNLVDNSIKYTDKGKIICGIKKKGNEVMFYIKDTGRGMKTEDLRIIFEKFRKGGSSTLRERAESSGFGLFVAKTFIEAHKGKIWAESAGKNKGSAFYFTLPMGK